MSTSNTHFYCPACREADYIEVETTSSVRVNAEGDIDWNHDDNGTSHCWGDGSQTHCSDCGYDGAWTDFQHRISADDAPTRPVESALRIATGGMEILSDAQVRQLAEHVTMALQIAKSGWRHDEPGAHDAAQCLEGKLSAIGDEMHRRELER